MQTPVTHILPLTLIRRVRLLPAPGKVLVRAGQEVHAADVVAETASHQRHVLLDVRRALQLSADEDLKQVFDRKVGEKIQKGDLIAQKGGLFKRVLVSPEDGVILAVMGGQVLIEAVTPPTQIFAGFDGRVAEVIADQGVVIETHGALLQGVWGNNQIGNGLLISLAKSPADDLSSSLLDVSMRGAVLLAGTCSEASALEMARDIHLRGLILGSISAHLIPLAEKLEFPVMVLEGFGQIPISTPAFRILSTSEKREVCLNATRWDAFHGERPELVIPLPAQGEVAQDLAALQAGRKVRLTLAPWVGAVGSIEQMLPGQTALPNGLRAPAARVRLENGEVHTVPSVNLDVLE
ncbi:hypothetical protein ADN00_03140 [Ornatilinea apprima]|uniref:KOW domain-containing protein n=1 Tax=Ornatilinea apprima TaxID=1134406 RepID=A0A0P6XGU5_9CHLR|nr:hypothetical protein [Ornatilinea apprima]KPL79336.1 hypothetical protein ADN00_03140 [Ornatilinea apprima]